MKTITPPLKWHGGKHYLAPRIVAIMPSHLHYVEPYAGGLSVLLAKKPDGVSEVVNDLDGDLTALWRVLQEPDTFERFHRLMEAVPFSEALWRHARDSLESFPNAMPFPRAAWFFICCRQSLAGRRDAFAPLSRTRTRRGMNEQASAWLSAVDGLPAVHERLKRVVIRSGPAIEVIRQEDGPETLFYCDPPYLHSTRATTKVYAQEMTVGDHCELLDVLLCCKGKVMLSGYPSELYDDKLAGWTRHAFAVANHAASGKKKGKEIEVLWCNR